VYVSVGMADTITESTFQQEVIESDQPVLVDFWAEWCGPCHAVAPILDQIAEERADQLRLVKVNIDEEPELARRFGIMSIPTMILFRDGEVVGGIKRPSVKQGDRVVFVVRSDVSDEVHLHGYDLAVDVAPGEPARIRFTADLVGRFEIELEGRHLPLAELEVEP